MGGKIPVYRSIEYLRETHVHAMLDSVDACIRTIKNSMHRRWYGSLHGGFQKSMVEPDAPSPAALFGLPPLDSASSVCCGTPAVPGSAKVGPHAALKIRRLCTRESGLVKQKKLCSCPGGGSRLVALVCPLRARRSGGWQGPVNRVGKAPAVACAHPAAALRA